MAAPLLVGTGWSGGFIADASRETLGKSMFRQRDWIPHNGAPLRKRGGFGWASTDLGSLGQPASYTSGIGWAPFSSDEHLVALSEAGRLFRLSTFDSNDGAYVGATGLGVQTHRPVWYKDRLILLQGWNENPSPPQKYYASSPGVYTVAALGGSPPSAKVGMTWLDYLVLGNIKDSGTTYANRLVFSGVGNSESWSTGTSFFDIIEIPEVVAFSQLRSLIVVFGFKETWMLNGDTPPPGGNLTKRRLFSQGCIDSRSVANYREYVLWANSEGVWKSDGTTLTELTLQGGISTYYRSLVSGIKLASGGIVSADIIHGCYFLSITNNAGVHVTTLRYDIERETWDEQTNIKATMYATRPASGAGSAELFFGHRLYPRVGKLAQLWLPDATNAYDADGLAVQPQLEFPSYKIYTFWRRRIIPAPQNQRYRRGWFSYDLRALPGGAPYFQADAVFSPESTAYETLTPTLPATTKADRFPANVRRKAHSVGFRLTQVGPSSDTRFYEVELEGHALEGSR
jgi:hypothetical protein